MVIGGGPAGLMAAEAARAAGASVAVYERMPSFGRRLLRAGVGGLNLTHSEPPDAFLARYGPAAPVLRPMIEAFAPSALAAWAEGLGQPTFVGSSGRVFPKAMKASPLLRAWLQRLSRQGVRLEAGRDWRGWDAEGALLVAGPDGEVERLRPKAAVLALGGASWPRLGADGGWVPLLGAAGAAVAPLRPANCGFVVDWSPGFRERFAGAPLKGLALSFESRRVRGEATIAAYGLEGGAVYILSAPLRDAIEREGRAVLELDLRPDLSEAEVARRLAATRASDSRANRLRKALGLAPAAINLLREGSAEDTAVKRVRLALTGTAPIERAISTAGGVAFDSVDASLMLTARPGVFVAGEMLDWEAPTGGYLLQASFATGVWAGAAAARFAAGAS